jgi:hypothetical protein
MLWKACIGAEGVMDKEDVLQAACATVSSSPEDAPKAPGSWRAKPVKEAPERLIMASGRFIRCLETEDPRMALRVRDDGMIAGIIGKPL